jgi:hypothetical protein
VPQAGSFASIGTSKAPDCDLGAPRLHRRNSLRGDHVRHVDQLVAAIFHEGILGVIAPDRVAGLDVAHDGRDGRPVVPDRVGEDRLRVARRVVDQRSDGLGAARLRAVRRPDPLAEEDVGALVDLGDGHFLRASGIEPRADEAVEEARVGVHLGHAHAEGVDQEVHLRDRVAADRAEDARLRHRAREHPGEIRRLVVARAEDAEVVALRSPRRSP